MNCTDAERYITEYFNDRLSDEDTLALFKHLDECPSCMEEFTIMQLVYASMSSSDDLNDLDSASEIRDRKREINRRLHKKDVTERLYLGLVYLGVTVSALAVLFIVM